MCMPLPAESWSEEPNLGLVTNQSAARNANGKIVKTECREIVVAEWKKQGGAQAQAKL